MKIGFLQFSPWFGAVSNNIEHVFSRLGNITADLIVLPECFNTGYLFSNKRELTELAEEIPNGKTCKALIDLSCSRNFYIIAGMPEKHKDDLYNSAILVGPKGYIGHYRKVHLFAEEKLYFTPGNLPFRVWEVYGARVGIMICFDWRFPEACRTLALQGADIIAHPANLILPHCPDAMVTRSLENGVFSITANRIGLEHRGGKILEYIGESQIVAPNGKILTRASSSREELCILDINPSMARNKKFNEYNDLLEDRRPELYNFH